VIQDFVRFFVHHTPVSPPPSKRLLGSLTRLLSPARNGMRHRSGRLALGALVSTVLTALVLSVPVVSGAGGGTPLVALDSFAATSAARTTHGDSPVVMGRDGGAVSSSTFAGVSTAPGARHSSTDAFAAPPSTPEVAPAPAETAAPADTAPPEAPAEAPSPPPVVEEAPAPPPPPAPEPAAVPANLGAEDQVLALVNIQRAAAGCGALSGDAALASVARAHSADMRDRGFFSHTNPDRLDPFARAAAAGLDARAENIAYGQPDPASVMDSWMNSPGHRANILDCSLTRLGVGMAEGAGGPWWTQLFA
jgi:uncharacterized protein YkwD